MNKRKYHNFYPIVSPKFEPKLKYITMQITIRCSVRPHPKTAEVVVKCTFTTNLPRFEPVTTLEVRMTCVPTSIVRFFPPN